jgi:hypothetical protein
MLVKKLIAGPTHLELDVSALDKLITIHTASSVESVSRASESYTNEVYRVRLKSGEICYVKFFDDEFHPDRACAELVGMEEARKQGIPVPDVILKDFSRNIFKRDFAIFSEIPGRVLLDDALNQPMLESCLETLTRLHAIKQNDYGFLYLPQTHWNKGDSYFDFLEDVIIYGLKKIVRQGYLVGDVYDCYAQYRGKIKEGDYCLNHGDFTAVL